jgi:hypothetical protein
VKQWRQNTAIREEIMPATFHPDWCHDLDDNQLEYREIDAKLWGPTNNVSPNDVSQGCLNNCYFVAGIRTVARAYPNCIRRAIKEVKPGVYDVTFLEMPRTGRSGKTSKAKKLPTIRVNNFFWVWADDAPKKKKRKKSKASGPSDAAYVKSFTGALWPLVLEKAWVKHCGGTNYADMNAGKFGMCNPGYVAQRLTEKFSNTLMVNVTGESLLQLNITTLYLLTSVTLWSLGYIHQTIHMTQTITLFKLHEKRAG